MVATVSGYVWLRQVQSADRRFIGEKMIACGSNQEKRSWATEDKRCVDVRDVEGDEEVCKTLPEHLNASGQVKASGSVSILASRLIFSILRDAGASMDRPSLPLLSRLHWAYRCCCCCLSVVCSCTRGRSEWALSSRRHWPGRRPS